MASERVRACIVALVAEHDGNVCAVAGAPVPRRYNRYTVVHGSRRSRSRRAPGFAILGRPAARAHGSRLAVERGHKQTLEQEA